MLQFDENFHLVCTWFDQSSESARRSSPIKTSDFWSHDRPSACDRISERMTLPLASATAKYGADSALDGGRHFMSKIAAVSTLCISVKQCVDSEIMRL